MNWSSPDNAMFTMSIMLIYTLLYSKVIAFVYVQISMNSKDLNMLSLDF